MRLSQMLHAGVGGAEGGPFQEKAGKRRRAIKTMRNKTPICRKVGKRRSREDAATLNSGQKRRNKTQKVNEGGSNKHPMLLSKVPERIQRSGDLGRRIDMSSRQRGSDGNSR